LADSPRITVVIPSLNQGAFLRQAIESVLGQGYPNLELMVVDGGSEDGSRTAIESYSDRLAWWVSEKDGGQADAINKGFSRATGDILAWLNADDMHLPGALETVAGSLRGKLDRAALVYGGCIHFAQQGGDTRTSVAPRFGRGRLLYQDYIDQPSAFWTRPLWDKVGRLQTRYRYVLDWEWFIRASRECSFDPLPHLLSLYRYHPAHKSGAGSIERRREILSVVEQYAPRLVHEAYIAVARSNLRRLKGWRYISRETGAYWLRYLYRPDLYLLYGEERLRGIISMFGSHRRAAPD
jgi:glycosyltransferase involved in cell wall biosynthesis